MKKMMKSILFAIVMLAFTANTFAQVLATANAAATIVAPLVIMYDNQSLNYGNLAVYNSAAGTVAVSAAAVASRTSTDVSLLTGITPTAARFRLTGLAGAAYTVSVPANSNITIGAGAANNMTIDTYIHSAIGTIPVGGTETFYVGATLHVNAVQNIGSYTGTFDVSVNYN